MHLDKLFVLKSIADFQKVVFVNLLHNLMEHKTMLCKRLKRDYLFELLFREYNVIGIRVCTYTTKCTYGCRCIADV